jgi:hypothetical protein
MSYKKKFYKYTSADAFCSVLICKKLKSSHPSLFNDSFDTLPDVISTFNPREDFQWEKFLGYIQSRNSTTSSNISLSSILGIISANNQTEIDLELTQNFRSAIIDYIDSFTERILATFSNAKILCVSAKNDNILMWSHYAKNHTGLVFEFEPGQNEKFQFLHPVLYRTQRPLLWDSFEQMLLRIQSKNDQLINDYIKDLLFTKNIDWAYEQELRMIYFDDGKSKEGHIYFDASELKAVYFGCKTEESKQTEILSLLENLDTMRHVQKYRMVRHPYSYELTSKKID